MKRKWLFRILRYGLGLLMALLIGWGFYGFIKDDNWLAVSSIATLVLAFGAFLAIWQNRSLQIRERRERLLNEIIDWVMDIRMPDIGITIPITADELTGQEQRRIEANVLFRYMIPTLRSEYIRAIVCKTFKKELENDVNDLIIILNAVVYIRSVRAGYKDVKDAFGWAATTIVEGVEKQISEGKKTIDQLCSSYNLSLDKSTTCILIKIGNIIAKL